jgi:hypothetical protein
MIITLYKTGKDGRILYYTVHDRQPVLDAPYALCASWRAGLGRERERLHRFQTLAERDRMIRQLIERRVRDGYRVLYSFNRATFSGQAPAGQPEDRLPAPAGTAAGAG